ncbi:MAG: RhuM family protein [Elusimicrobiota bacterium]
MKKDNQQSQIVIYKTVDGQAKVEVRFENETVWLTQNALAELFQTTKQNISQHIKNIFAEGELQPNSVIKDFLTTAVDGKNYVTNYYNLDMIISVGYRIKSSIATAFRQWATERLKEYIVKGFTLDDVRLKQGGRKSRYFEELLQRIRDIRSSERMLYQKVTDIYSTSIDYRKDAKETALFFKTVQNKMHFAVSGKTAAEIVAERVDKNKKNLGLTNFPGYHPIKRDIYIAKNYLHEKELQMLNRIVDAYLSFAEIQAISEEAMTMKDWIKKLDEYLALMGKGILKNAGTVSAEDAQNRADKEFVEYKKYEDKKYISDFDREVRKLLEKPIKKREGKMRKFVMVLGLMVVNLSFCLADPYDFLAKKISKGAKQLTNKKIAVLPFQYYDGRKSHGLTIVAEYLTTKIVEQGKVQVIERTLLDKIMDEMKLGKSGIIDQETTKELGKVLGVEAIVTGVLIEEIEEGMKVEEVNINTRLIKVETGGILIAANKKVRKTWEDEPITDEKPVEPSVSEVEHGIPPKPEIIRVGPPRMVIEEDVVPVIPPQLKQSYRSLMEGRYRDAMNEAKNVFHNNQDKPFIASQALFIIGKASESDGDIRKARDAYLRVIKDYPFNRNVVQKAQRRLQDLNRMKRR